MILALDIGGTKITSALWDGKNLLDIEKFPTPKVSATEFIDVLNSHLKKRIESNEIQALGVASAGPIHVESGSLINPVNLGNGDASWERVDLKRSLLPNDKIFKWIDSDAALAAYAEFCRRGGRDKDLVALTIGTGIGLGAIIEGQIARAGRGMHPELGHLIISDEMNPAFPTPFADFGTIESYLSGHFFSLRLGKELGQELHGTDVVELAQSGDPVVIKAFDLYAKRMAIAIANICLIYAPSLVVLAGGFAEQASPFFLEKTLQLLHQILQSRSVGLSLVPKVEIAQDTHHLSLLGAAYAAENFKS